MKNTQNNALGFIKHMDKEYGPSWSEDDAQLAEALVDYANEIYGWKNYPDERPKNYGKYFVMRKDGKVHWETWNGTGFAYNNNEITHFMIISTPIVN
jgi:hypothetical protein